MWIVVRRCLLTLTVVATDDVVTPMTLIQFVDTNIVIVVDVVCCCAAVHAVHVVIMMIVVDATQTGTGIRCIRGCDRRFALITAHLML